MSSLTVVTRLSGTGPLAWFRDLIRAEWTKFRGTRSTYFCLAALVAVGIGVGGIVAQATGSRWSHMSAPEQAGFDPLLASFRGFDIGQLIIGSLGVLMITSEYASGLIRMTLAAVPQRRSVLAAKSSVIGAVALLLGLATSFAAFFLAQDLLQPTGRALSITAAGALRAVLCMGTYVAVIALLGVALGALLRHTAGAIAALFAAVFLLPGIISSLPKPWNHTIGQWLPDNLVGQLISQHSNPDMLSRPASFAVMLSYPAVFLALAAWRTARTDA